MLTSPDRRPESVPVRPSAVPLRRPSASVELADRGDPLEREADAFARRAATAPPLPRRAARCTCGGSAGPGGECAACRAKRTRGRPLGAADRASFEARLGADLGAVRVHEGPVASSAARALDAEAFTVGEDVTFAAGRYRPETEAGRTLLAHELAHVVQQQRGRASRRPQRVPVSYTIVPDHAPMEPGQVLILMAMKARNVGAAEAERLIKADEFGCGEHPACLNGVNDTKPIQFTIDRGGPAPKKPTPKPVPKPAPTAEEELDAIVRGPPPPVPADIQTAMKSFYLQRFIEGGRQSGFIKLPGVDPSSDDYDAVRYVRDVVLRLSDREVKCFKDYAGDQEFGTWNALGKALFEFGKRKLDLCYPTEDIQSPHALERLRGAEQLYQTIKIYEGPAPTPAHPASSTVLPEGSRDSVQAHEWHEQYAHVVEHELGMTDFKSIEDFDRTATDFRRYFRADALRIADGMLFETGRVLQDARVRYKVGDNPNIRGRDQVSADAQQLYDELRLPGGRSLEQLQLSHPILRDPAALKATDRTTSAYQFSNALSLFALERLRDLGFVQNNLRREPNVVFRFDVVVASTLADLGLDAKSVHAAVIRDQRGESLDESSLFHKLLKLGLELLLFVMTFLDPPIALTAMAVNTGMDLTTGSIDYMEQSNAYRSHLTSEEPSLTPVLERAAIDLAPMVIHVVATKPGPTPELPSAPPTTVPETPAATFEPPRLPPPETELPPIVETDVPPPGPGARPTPVMLYDWAGRPGLYSGGVELPTQSGGPFVLGPEGRFPPNPARPVRLFTPEGDSIYFVPGRPPFPYTGPTPLYVRPGFGAGVLGGQAPGSLGVPLFSTPSELTWLFDEPAQDALMGRGLSTPGFARVGPPDPVPLWTSPTESGFFLGGRQLTPRYVAPLVPQNQAWRASAMLARRAEWDLTASLRNMALPDYLAQADVRVAQLVENAQVRVRAPVASVTEIVRSGRLLTQFETGTTGGLLDQSARRSVEAGLFATPLEAGGAQRPIYGYLSGTQEVTTAQYGDVVLELKPAVRARTTFTFGDSLDETARGMRPDVAGEPLTRPTALAAQVGTDPLELGSLADVRAGAAPRRVYTEAQIHGGVTLADIKEVVFTNGVIPSADVRAALEAAGISWRMVAGPTP